MSGGTVTPPQTSTAQIPSFGITIPSTAQQQQQQQQQQLHNTLSHLFPNGAPFSFPCFNAINAAAAAAAVAAGAGPQADFAGGVPPGALRNSPYDFAGQAGPTAHSRIKIKRCRQRVDAGEPRNSYQSQLKSNGGARKDPISLNEVSQFSLGFDYQGQNNNNGSNNNNNNVTHRFSDGALSENDYAEDVDGTEGSENGGGGGGAELNCPLSASKSSSASSIVTSSSSSAKRKSYNPKRQHAAGPAEDQDHPSDPFCDSVAENNNGSCNNNNSNNNNNNNEEEEDEEEDGEENYCNKEYQNKPMEHSFDYDEPKIGYSANDASALKIVINRRYNTVSSVNGGATDEDNDDDDGDPSENGSDTLAGGDDAPLIAASPMRAEDLPATAAAASARSSPAENVAGATNLLTSLFLTNNNNNNNVDPPKSVDNNNMDLQRFQSLIEAQRRLYSTIFLEQQHRSVEEPAPKESGGGQRAGSSALMFQQQQNLPCKTETKPTGPNAGIFGPKKPAGSEQFAHLMRFIEAMTLAQRQQQQMAEMLQQQKQRCPPQPQQQVQNLLGGTAPNLLAMNPALAAIAAAAAAANNRSAAAVAAQARPAYRFGPENSPVNGAGGVGGIFPPMGSFSAPLHGLVGSSLFPGSAAPYRDDSGPRRKRAKVTDSVRGPRSSLRADCASGSQPASERSSPLAGPAGAYFPPTMVAPSHPSALYGRAGGSQSPANASSDEFPVADYFSTAGGGVGASALGALDGLHQQMYTLTHVHLRKAKLMFFYTRYPSSAVLKTYFPDIHFNKNNTAQLVKWFSNFREFYYMQMEKYAKQAIAEGVRHRNDITVTPDSEIYKQLNQHYNRNNLIQPPARLQYVIQETLKEFFVALQAGKDAEPSWKKVIYKVIQQLDDPIPEYFKDPNFIETLEQS